MDQGLLIRNPGLTPEEFSKHWYTVHAPLVVPMFLYLGVRNYEQIHAPFDLPSSSSTLNTSTFDGVVALPPPPLSGILPEGIPRWVQAYYDEVVKVDEKRFLVSEALKHIVRVTPGSVGGDVRVVIGEGKVLVDVPERVWQVWRGYEEQSGKEEEDEEGNAVVSKEA
ncbi:uncharacterized protein RCO7_08654 [Rhynchosporium graminicola]|uniref:EthD domain-containing protein n=1 Tax=Rhynchosporium graminicola TaxID=2792576 RepID=A0A1E1LMP1_9HELO|nr:uncharacterized protein RCO7_08654 [Rhynchosporium commune]